MLCKTVVGLKESLVTREAQTPESLFICQMAKAYIQFVRVGSFAILH